MTQVRYVLGYHLVGYVAAAATKIPSCPQVASPKLLVQMRKLAQQLVRTLSLQPLYQSADRYLRRYRDKQMYMIFRHMPLHDRHFVLTTDLPVSNPSLALLILPSTLVADTSSSMLRANVSRKPCGRRVDIPSSPNIIILRAKRAKAVA